MKKYRLDIKSILPYLAAIVQAVMYGLASHIFFNSWLIGLAAGVLPSLTMAYGASQISDIAKSRRGLAWSIGGVLFLFSPIAVAPAIFLDLSALPLPLILKIMTAIVWATLPDASIVLAGAIAGKSFVKQSETQIITAQDTPKGRSNKKQVARKPISDNELLAFLQANQGASQNQIADNFHVTRQAIGARVKKLYATSER